jgi:hypothetical protein
MHLPLHQYLEPEMLMACCPYHRFSMEFHRRHHFLRFLRLNYCHHQILLPLQFDY